MIRIFKSENQQEGFYAMMGQYFASLDIAKELERQLYNKPNTTWIISTYKTTVCGFASVCDCGNNYYLDNLYVIPEYRSNRLASEIVEEICEMFNDKPIKCIAANPYSIRIFEKNGFEKVGNNGKWNKYIKH